MPTFYLDENVSLKIVPFVQAAGHSVVTYLGEGLKGERDDVHSLHDPAECVDTRDV